MLPDANLTAELVFTDKPGGFTLITDDPEDECASVGMAPAACVPHEIRAGPDSAVLRRHARQCGIDGLLLRSRKPQTGPPLASLLKRKNL